MAERKALIGNGPRQQEGPPRGTGRRIIGQNAEHERHLEKEYVLDKKKKINKNELTENWLEKVTMLILKP